MAVVHHSFCSPTNPSYLYSSEWECSLYALLADLQNTLQTNSANLSSSNYGMHVTSHSYQYQHGEDSFNEQPTYQNQRYEVESYSVATRDGSGASGKIAAGDSGRKNTGARNINELDSLLEDLNSARYSGTTSNPGYATISDSRPTIDSLLNELSTAVGNKDESAVSSKSNPAASSATQELDVLMASLSTFKGGAPGTSQPITVSVSPAPSATSFTTTEPAYAKPNKVQRAGTGTKDQLDSMLGNLQADMNKQGISATQKGCCSACDKPIVGQVITALGRTWHPEHFVCSHCRQELGTKNFFERDGQPYCEPDYHNLFSPRCAYCNGPILDKCVTALDQTWHPDHFFCAQCGCQFGEEGFHEKDGKPYCKNDYLAMFALKCKGCTMAITEGYISALSAQWHPQCFVCRDCRLPVSGKSFYTMDGKPVCGKCIGAGSDDEDEEEEEESD